MTPQQAFARVQSYVKVRRDAPPKTLGDLIHSIYIGLSSEVRLLFSDLEILVDTMSLDGHDTALTALEREVVRAAEAYTHGPINESGVYSPLHKAVEALRATRAPVPPRPLVERMREALQELNRYHHLTPTERATVAALIKEAGE